MVPPLPTMTTILSDIIEKDCLDDSMPPTFNKIICEKITYSINNAAIGYTTYVIKVRILENKNGSVIIYVNVALTAYYIKNSGYNITKGRRWQHPILR